MRAEVKVTEGAPAVRDLIAAARDGDVAARDRLLGRYRGYMVLLARMSAHRTLRAKFDASDVAQDALIRAQQGLPEFRGATEGELLAWLRRILVRTLSNTRRAYRADARDVGRERPIEDLVDASSRALSRLPAARGTSPSRGAERREAGLLVVDGLARLAEDDREVITLRSLEERAWSDVAARMGRSEEAVRALWGRAVQRLGRTLRESPEEDRDGR